MRVYSYCKCSHTNMYDNCTLLAIRTSVHAYVQICA